MKKLLTWLVVLALLLVPTTMMVAAAGAPVIDTTKKGSLDIFKYDLTAATADGVWTPGSYVSTGVYDQTGVNDVLGDEQDVGVLTNGDTVYGYAVKGVEFTYLRVADVSTQTIAGKVQTLYGFAKNDTTAALLAALGMAYTDAVMTDGANTVSYFTSDSIFDAMEAAATLNSTTLKNALEDLVAANGGTAMPLTDSYGHTEADELALGLYLIVETKVPETIVGTVTPFFVSLPMTSVDGDEWIYDITVYPKNASAVPTLEKTVREAATSGGTSDEYAKAITASIGDTAEYRVVSKLPPITSKASYLTKYVFTDTLPAGMTHVGTDVTVEIFADDALTDLVATWDADQFTAAVSGQTLTVTVTADGLTELNTSNAVYDDPADTDSGYSGLFMVVKYGATVGATAVLGDTGSTCGVTLTWERTSANYFGTISDDVHVHSFAFDLTKTFSDGDGDVANVKFLLKNTTDGKYIVAALADGVYTVTGYADAEADATVLVPTADGKVVVRGLEADTYAITETETDDGYMLLDSAIEMIITAENADAACTGCLDYALTASATVNGQDVAMTADTGSDNAVVPFSVINYRETPMPDTGENGMKTLIAAGIMMVAASVAVIMVATRRKEADRA